MKNLSLAFKAVFKSPLYLFLAISLAVNLLALYYFIFLETTTFKVFFDSNTSFYSWASIILTVLIGVSFGISATFLIWQLQKKAAQNPANLSNSFIGTLLGGLSIGCPVCGAFLLSVFGLAGGLFIFPFQGLEIKAISLFLLGFAIFLSAKSISQTACGVEKTNKEGAILKIEQGKFVLTLNKETVMPLMPAFIGFFLLFSVAFLPLVANKFNFGFAFQKKDQVNLAGIDSSDNNLPKAVKDTKEQINPPEGFTINAVYGDIGPKLLAAGAIDFEKMRTLYEKAGAQLTEEQITILTKGSNEKIKITPQNSYFLLNLLWAFGLANKNQILDEGPMAQYGKDKIGNFASTGGWTLGTKKSTELYSASEIIKLNSEQQKILDDFAFNSYRPCCSNPTGFPDCNHGMAALGLGEIMAGQGASVDEIFEAFKYINAFWFPQTYFDIAKYFQAKEEQDWSQVSGREVAGKDFSTPQGWQRVRGWLKTNNLLEEAPSGGGGCGV
ncbi:MAG: hypothetical protein Q7S82_02370 [bacterium]|nr:hypothetical protein [bacterium]